MPHAIDTVAGVAASGTVAAVTVPFTPASGDSFAVRNFNPPSAAYLDLLMSSVLQVNPVRLRSPMLHDNVQGLRFQPLTVDASNLITGSYTQPLQAQDSLIAELLVVTAPGVTENETIAWSIYYPDLPGSSARLYSPGDIQGNIKNLWTVPVSITPSATAGNWASAAINSVYDLFQANTDYAVLGYELSAACTAIAVRGPDTSNLRVGGPGIADVYKTRQWFSDMTMWRGSPHIPVINSANKSATFVDLTTRLTATAVVVTLLLAELATNLT